MEKIVFVLAMFGLFTVPRYTACPEGMVAGADRSYCIDRYEWPNRAGELPAVGISAKREYRSEELSAEELCASVGKRLCGRGQWVAACKGTPTSAGVCNNAMPWRAPREALIAERDAGEFKRLNQSTRSGERALCQSHVGAQDMLGNVEEWVTCEGGTGYCLMGRYWSEAVTCGYTVRSHVPNWHYYETGFRCCLEQK